MGRALLVLEGPQERQTAISWINKAPVGTRVEFKASKRSLPQNDLMWALLTEVAQQLEHGGRKYDPTQWKSIFLSAFGREITFLPSLDLKTFLPIELSSSDLGKDEMTDFIEFILKEGAERGVVFHTNSNSDPGASPPPADDAPLASSQEPDPAPSPADQGSNTEPAEQTFSPPEEPAGSVSLFPQEFKFSAGELQHLKDFARKALDDASSDNDVPAKEVAIDRMRLNYQDAIESKDGHQALSAMEKPIAAVIAGKRTREQAATYLAREIIGCEPSELEGRR